MRKMAVFVEGQTELIFAQELLRKIATAQNIRFDWSKVYGPRGRRQFVQSRREPEWNSEYYAEIYESGSDGTVATDINERYDALMSAGFQVIVGIRDVYPTLKRDAIPAFVEGFRRSVRSDPVVPTLVLATMEIEAWFLSEHTHFARVRPELTVDLIKKKLGFDPRTENMELRQHPKIDMKKAYALVGAEYGTDESSVWSTVTQRLDLDAMYLEVALRVPSLGLLVDAIDPFFATSLMEDLGGIDAV